MQNARIKCLHSISLVALVAPLVVVIATSSHVVATPQGVCRNFCHCSFHRCLSPIEDVHSQITARHHRFRHRHSPCRHALVATSIIVACPSHQLRLTLVAPVPDTRSNIVLCLQQSSTALVAAPTSSTPEDTRVGVLTAPST